MLIQTIKDGEKNFSLMVKGYLSGDIEPQVVVDIAKFKPPGAGWKGIRLDSAAWAIQEKLGFLLLWAEGNKEEDLIFPMESRNGMQFDEGLPSPRVHKGWEGKIYISSFNFNLAPAAKLKSFFILLDFDKQ